MKTMHFLFKICVGLPTLVFFILSHVFFAYAGESANKLCDEAYQHFEKAQFDKALTHYMKTLNEDPTDYEANYRIGYIYMLSNQHALAEKYLKKAIELKPKEKDPKKHLAEVFYRQDKFKDAVPLYEEIGQSGRAKQLASFGSRTPYKVVGDVPETSIPFMMIDPLPMFKIKVNDKEIVVLLDTGGAQIIIDSEFAREIGADVYGSREAVFGGGKKRTLEFGAVESVTFGDFKIENVPVAILPTRGLMRLGDMELNGIVGTVFLYHFLSTIDYPGQKLILRRFDKNPVENKIEDKIVTQTPFWMAGDHYILSWGTANKSEPLFLFMDTGLAGGAFSFLRSVAEGKIGLHIDESSAQTAMGGGGPFTCYPMTVEEMTLGQARCTNLNGIVAENRIDLFEFPIDGIISHNFFKNYSVTFDFKNMEIIMIDK